MLKGIPYDMRGQIYHHYTMRREELIKIGYACLSLNTFHTCIYTLDIHKHTHTHTLLLHDDHHPIASHRTSAFRILVNTCRHIFEIKTVAASAFDKKSICGAQQNTSAATITYPFGLRLSHMWMCVASVWLLFLWLSCWVYIYIFGGSSKSRLPGKLAAHIWEKESPLHFNPNHIYIHTHKIKSKSINFIHSRCDLAASCVIFLLSICV